MTNNIFFSTLLLLVGIQSLQGQIRKDSELFSELKIQDSIFFEQAFNQCNLEYLDKVIHKDLNFYHDQGGIQDKVALIENTKKNICSDPNKKPIRKVIEQSLEVFPLYDNGVLYGAIHRGDHNFYIRESNKEDIHTSGAKFTNLYLLKNGKWILKEVLSFDHNDHEKSYNSISFEEEIEALLIQEKVPALGLGIIINGQLTKVQVLGDLKEGTPAPYNSIFKVASLTKPIVALVTLNLISSGQLALDEPLYNYWIDPDIKNDKRYKKLTPKIILTHQSGFPNWRYLNKQNKLTFEFDPETKYQYSGEGFEYLRKALEIKFGQSIEELADSLIFQPAKMTDTHFWWDKRMDEKRYAVNHDKHGKQLSTDKYYEANAAGNLLTTVEDYGNFIAFVLNGGGLSQSLFTKMVSSHVKLKENDYFGLGWEKLTNFSTENYALIHTGKDPGVSTLAIMFPNTKNGYVIFLNGDNADKIYERLLTKYMYLGNELWNRR